MYAQSAFLHLCLGGGDLCRNRSDKGPGHERPDPWVFYPLWKGEGSRASVYSPPPPPPIGKDHPPEGIPGVQLSRSIMSRASVSEPIPPIGTGTKGCLIPRQGEFG
jgi:hypothetical protein